MSRYTVEHVPFVDRGWSDRAARMLYQHPAYPWAREQFTLEEYQELVAQDVVGEPGVLCFGPEGLVGAMAISTLTYDHHMPGKGVWVFHSIAHPDHPAVGPVLYRWLVRNLRQRGASWVRIGKRLSLTRFQDEYRRLDEQAQKDS